MDGALCTDPQAICPACGHVGNEYQSLPASRLVYEIDGAEIAEILPPMRNFECRNCDAEWFLIPTEEA